MPFYRLRNSFGPAYRSRKWTWRVAFLTLAGVLVIVTAQAFDEVGERQAFEAISQGGQVVYLRHTERGQGPKENLSAASRPEDYEDCSRQRNLTATGREQARELGMHWRSLGIPVGKVYANAQCRTRDTALIAFGRAEVTPHIFDTEFVRHLLLQRPTDRTNTVVVGSDSQLRDLTGVQLVYGEVALLEGDGRGGLRVVATLELDDWQAAAAAKRRFD
jgi:hypothetical protein